MKDIKVLTKIGFVAALMCVLGPVVIMLPISPVPLSLTTFAIYLSVYLLCTKWATVSCLIYLLLGLVGVPVFSAFSGGPGKLFGPTGGYLIGYILIPLVGGFFLHHFKKSKWIHAMGLVLGTICCYGLGTIWLVCQSKMEWTSALFVGVVPFIAFDAVKIAVAMIVGEVIAKRLKIAGLQ